MTDPRPIDPRAFHPRLAIVACSLLGLMLGPMLAGCAPEHEPIEVCEDAEGIRAVCGFQNPEDLARLPDDRTLVVSQYGVMNGSRPGNLALYDHTTDALEVVYPSEASDPDPGAGQWGDPACPGPPPASAFSPHGIDLARQGDGALRLLVVNHGGREAIEFFEVGEGPAGYSIEWRGCAAAPDGLYLNDVVNLPDGGFLVTHMMDKESETMELLRASFGAETGRVYRWRPDPAAWAPQPGSDAPFPNGIELSADGRTIFLNVYSGNEVRRIDLASGEVTGRVDVTRPDNSSWGLDGRLLVASHTAGLVDLAACAELTEGTCPMRFQIVAIDPETLERETLLEHAGPPMGGATVALDLGDELILGSFSSDRVVRVDRGPTP